MARLHTIIRHLRPSTLGMASAGALYDPTALLALQATRKRRTAPRRRPSAPCAAR
jgi:hypothetical protein